MRLRRIGVTRLVLSVDQERRRRVVSTSLCLLQTSLPWCTHSKGHTLPVVQVCNGSDSISRVLFRELHSKVIQPIAHFLVDKESFHWVKLLKSWSCLLSRHSLFNPDHEYSYFFSCSIHFHMKATTNHVWFCPEFSSYHL